MTRTRHLVGALFAALLLIGSAGAAQAQPRQEGLVNVYADDVTVQIPIAVVANICGVAVNVLVQDVEQGLVDCEGVALAEADDGNGDAQAPDQRGLINVSLTNITVQVPVAVAANVCGVAVNLLVAEVEQGEVDCEAFAEAVA
jgi:hypothetical protein